MAVCRDSQWCVWCLRYSLSPSDGPWLSVEALLEGAALLERDLVHLSASNATEGALPYMVRDGDDSPACWQGRQYRPVHLTWHGDMT